MEIVTTDYHTAGEPFRIVPRGRAGPPGATVAERRRARRGVRGGRARAPAPLPRAARARRHVRRLPRRRPTTTAPTSACCSGTRTATRPRAGTGRSRSAPGRWSPGLVAAPDDGDVDVTIDVPSGRVVASVRCRGGAVERVAFRNVPAYVIARGVPAAGVEADVAFGGAIYAFVPAARFGLRVRPADLPALIAAGREVKAALEGTDGRAPPDRRPPLRHLRHRPARGARAAAPPQRRDLRRRRGRPLADGLGDLGAHRAAARRRRARRRGGAGATTPSSGTAVPRARDRRAPPRACSPRSRAPRSARASTASSSTRATRSAPASSCAEPSRPAQSSASSPKQTPSCHRRAGRRRGGARPRARSPPPRTRAGPAR